LTPFAIATSPDFIVYEDLFEFNDVHGATPTLTIEPSSCWTSNEVSVTATIVPVIEERG